MTPRKSSELPLAAALSVATLLLLLWTDSFYGTTYDEPIYQAKSLRALEWVGLLLRSPSEAVAPATIAQYWDAKDQHPGFYKLLTGLAAATVGKLAPPREVMRTGTNLLVSLGVAGLYLMVASVLGRAAAVYAVGALLLMPRVFGHCHLAALDAPVMALSFLTVAAAFAAVMTGPEHSGRGWAWSLTAGLLWGLALGTKLNAFFVPFVVFPWALLYGRRHLLQLSASFATLGPLVFWLTWPWLWYDTWTRFSQYFAFHFSHWEIGVLYFGRVWNVAPWHYPLVMVAITTPPATLLLALWGLRGLRWPTEFPPERQVRALIALAMWGFVVNIVPSCLPNSPKYNGVRLFLPALIFLALLAAGGFCQLRAAVRHGMLRIGLRVAPSRLAGVLVFAALIGPLAALARFTPFHLSYYNAFVGGLPGAVRAGMEPTYWGDTYRSAAWWLAANAPAQSVIWIEPAGLESTVRLFELGPMRPDLRCTAGNEGFSQADYAVFQNKPTEFSDLSRRLLAHSKPVFTDGVDGVPLIYVFKLR